MLLGLAAGGSLTLCYTIGGLMVPTERRTTAFGFFSGAALFGGAISPSIAGLLTRVHFKAIYWADALLYLLLALALLPASSRCARDGRPRRSPGCGGERMKTCHHCSRELTLASPIERTASCPHCFSDLKCCQNCRFFDPGFNNQCREPQAEWCPEKYEGELLRVLRVRGEGGDGPRGFGGSPTDQSRARSAFDSLFKK